jgi:NADH:flavin oxidoreductase / NADH oxidase family
MSDQPLFTPFRMGDLDLPNRIVMAPLTRMRAHPLDHVPTPLQAEYYAQQVREDKVTSNTSGNPTDFPVFSGNSDRQILMEFVLALCAITGLELKSEAN